MINPNFQWFKDLFSSCSEVHVGHEILRVLCPQSLLRLRTMRGSQAKQLISVS